MTAISRLERTRRSAVNDDNQVASSISGRFLRGARHARRLPVPGPQTPGFVSTTTAFAGLLLALTPLLWAGNATGEWTVAGWNEAILGIAITVLGLARLTQHLRLVVATGLGCVFGAWIALAPLVLDYGLDPDSTPATIVDVLVGTSILIITILGHVDAHTRFDQATDRAGSLSLR